MDDRGNNSGISVDTPLEIVELVLVGDPSPTLPAESSPGSLHVIGSLLNGKNDLALTWTSMSQEVCHLGEDGGALLGLKPDVLQLLTVGVEGGAVETEPVPVGGDRLEVAGDE